MKVLCVGDSLTYGYDVELPHRWTFLVERRAPVQICNEGLCGDTTAGMALRMQRMPIKDYDAVFVMGGSNDILQDIPVAVIEAHMQQIMKQVVAAGKPLLVGIPLQMKKESAYWGWQRLEDVERHNRELYAYRQWLLAQCSRYQAVPIDFYRYLADREAQYHTSLYADGIHPNEAGYALMAEAAISCMSCLYKKARTTDL